MPMTIKLSRGVFIMRDSQPQSHMTLESCGFARSFDKLKAFYIRYHSGCDHKTWHDED